MSAADRLREMRELLGQVALNVVPAMPQFEAPLVALRGALSAPARFPFGATVFLAPLPPGADVLTLVHPFPVSPETDALDAHATPATYATCAGGRVRVEMCAQQLLASVEFPEQGARVSGQWRLRPCHATRTWRLYLLMPPNSP